MSSLLRNSTLETVFRPFRRTFVLNVNDPWGLHQKFLPEHHSNLVIQLDSNIVQDSLITALNSCLEAGTDACEFLREFCRCGMGPLEQDPALQQSLAALQTVRKVDPRSSAWWTEMPQKAAENGETQPSEEGSLPVFWQEAAVRVKMCEYLCLLAHQEVLDVLDGKKVEEQCLADAIAMREILVTGLQWLQKRQPFTCVTREQGAV